MKYKTYISPENKLDVRLTSLKVDEFLKEYWSNELYYVTMPDGRITDSIALLDAEKQKPIDQIGFYAFADQSDFLFFKDSGFEITPHRKEVFQFIITTQYLQVCFYNSLEGNERERQFQKIVGNIRKCIESEYHLLRICQKQESITHIMCRYRKSEGQVSFSLVPCADSPRNKKAQNILISASDFKYLFPFIQQIYPQFGIGGSFFDPTSSNFITRKEWIPIINNLKNYKTTDTKLAAFFAYIIRWLQTQLAWAEYIDVRGNL